MKTLSISTTQVRPSQLWQVAGLSNSDGIALLGQISEGLDGKVASLIVDWTKITQNDLRKMSGIPSTTFSRGMKARFTVPTRANDWCVSFVLLTVQLNCLRAISKKL